VNVVIRCYFKHFNNILNSEILLNLIRKMKYFIDQFQLCFLFALAILSSSDVFETVTFETETSLKLRDRGFVKNCETKTEIRDRDFIKNSETETRDFKISGFSGNFSKNVVTASQVDFFRISRIFSTCFHGFLPANTTEKKLVELQFYFAIFL